MALTAFTGTYSHGIGSVTMRGSFTDDEFVQGKRCAFQWGYGNFANTTSHVDIFDNEGNFNRTPVVDKDRTIKFRAKVFPIGAPGDVVFGDTSGDFKTYADAAFFPGGLTPGTPTPTTCPVSGSVNPKTNESTGIVTMQARIQGTSEWIENGPPIATGLSGLSAIALSGTLTGLLTGTTYEARFKIERTTENSAENFSPIGTFTTQSSIPIIISPSLINIGFATFLPVIVNLSPIVIAPALINLDVQTFTPALSFGVGPTEIKPNPMEVTFQMLPPEITKSQKLVFEAFVMFNDVIERDVNVG